MSYENFSIKNENEDSVLVIYSNENREANDLHLNNNSRTLNHHEYLACKGLLQLSDYKPNDQETNQAIKAQPDYNQKDPIIEKYYQVSVLTNNNVGDDQDFHYFFPYYHQPNSNENETDINKCSNVCDDDVDKNESDVAIESTLTDHTYAKELNKSTGNIDETILKEIAPENEKIIKQEIEDNYNLTQELTNLDSSCEIIANNIEYKESIENSQAMSMNENNFGYFEKDQMAQDNNIYLNNNYVDYSQHPYYMSMYNNYQFNSEYLPSFSETYNPNYNHQQTEEANNGSNQMMMDSNSLNNYSNDLYSNMPYSIGQSGDGHFDNGKAECDFSVNLEDRHHSIEGGNLNNVQLNNGFDMDSSNISDDINAYVMDKENEMPIEEMQRINSKYTHQRFPIKLWNLASDENFKPIRWSQDGMSLIIDEYTLEPNLGYFFRSKKFSSFLRQLHLYGFRKVTRARNHRSATTNVRVGEIKSRSDCISEYQCQLFQRDQFDLVKNVRRFYGNQTNSTPMGTNMLDSVQMVASSSNSSSVSSTSPLMTQISNVSPQSSRLTPPTAIQSQMDNIADNNAHSGCEYYEVLPAHNTGAMDNKAELPSQQQVCYHLYSNTMEPKYYGMNDSCSFIDYHQAGSNYQQSLLAPGPFA